jgi:hypothetical protein
MQAKLEDLLKSKERELKLHQRFLDLKTFCEAQIFPYINLPIQQHVETLKQIVEHIVPDPRDRTEELFSGEIFTLLGTVYLHDIELVKSMQWSSNPAAMNGVAGSRPAAFLSYEIAKNLDIPEMAMEIINYLTFSDLVKRIPLEWAITEDSRRAIIRNTRLIDRVFNFSHLLVDVFSTELEHSALKRFRTPVFPLRPQSAEIDIDSREGVITIHYRATLPYELHTLGRARPFVENGFNAFKNGVNGKLGFQYRDLLWDITENLETRRTFFELPRFTPYNEFEEPPLDRHDEASEILDRLFTHGYAMVVGSLSTGKTTVLKAFLMPQLLAISKNVFYVELWDHPVHEIRDVIGLRRDAGLNQSIDIVLLCRELLREGPCFFILDGCERLGRVSGVEREKLQRFLDFCLSQDNMYVVAVGDMDSFFGWFDAFSGMSMAAIYEVKPVDRTRMIDAMGGERVVGEEEEPLMPVELELRKADTDIEELLGRIFDIADDRRAVRNLIAALLGSHDGHLRRYTVDNVQFNTALSKDLILQCLAKLQRDDIVRQTESMEMTYYALSSLSLREPLYRVFELKEFDERQTLREALQSALAEKTMLDGDMLSRLSAWKDDMMFAADESGVILAGLIHHSLDWRSFHEKMRRDGRGVDIQPLLALLLYEDRTIRAEAVILLGEIGNKAMINPLLFHFTQEGVPEIRSLLVRAIGGTRGKGAILAVMKTLQDMGDVALRMEALDFFDSLLGPEAEEIFIEMNQKEKTPAVRESIDRILLKIRET